MTTTLQNFTALAARIGAVAQEHAAEHDRDATFVTEAYDAMREHGYLKLAVPVELGGLGASMRQVCHAQAELARHDGATALSVAMHLYLTLMQAYRYRKGAPDAEAVLRRVADEGIVIATSGGSDWLWPTTRAVPVEDGFLVSGRKVFCSQSPAATVVATCAVLGEPGEDAQVLHFSVPLAAPGVRLEDTWDTLGMRGTASHDVVLEDVFVPADKISARRPYGELGAPLLAATVHFAPVGGATYHGIAAGARVRRVRRAAVAGPRRAGRADRPLLRARPCDRGGAGGAAGLRDRQRRRPQPGHLPVRGRRADAGDPRRRPGGGRGVDEPDHVGREVHDPHLRRRLADERARRRAHRRRLRAGGLG